jgi:hypothetical protein
MSAEAMASPVASATDERWDVGRSGGRLVVAWQNPETRLIAPVGLLEHPSETEYRFRYLRRAIGLSGFRSFLSFPDFDRTYVSSSLFPLFAQRIMSPRRPDFSQFLRQLDLDERASPWEQLARSEGRSSGDTVQVFPVPTVESSGRTECRFLVHGVRHVAGAHLPALRVGDPLSLEADPSNPINPAAVRVVADDAGLGYVPDLLLDYLEAVRCAGPVGVTVAHVNGPEAPAHLRVLALLEGHAPAGYSPMTGPAWETFEP